MRKFFALLLGVLLLTLWSEVALLSETGIDEYELWPEEGQIVGLYDEDDNFQLYEVKRVRLDANGGLKYAECNHLFYELADGPPRTYTLVNATPATSMAAAIVGTRWEVGSIDASLAALTEDFTENYRNPLEMLRIIERDYSARLSFRIAVADHEVTNLYIDLLEIDTDFAGQRFEFGHNLKNIEIIVDRDGIKTALVGLGLGDEIDLVTGEPKYLTFASINGGVDWVGDNDARLLYGIPSNGTMLHRYGVYKSEAQTAETLIAATRVQVARQSVPKVTIEADVADLETVKIVDIATGNLIQLDHEKIRLNNITQVIARSKGLLAAVEAKVSRIERYLKQPNKNRVTFGDPIALGSDYLKALEDELIWTDKVRRKLDRGRGPATVIVASEDSSYQPWYANIVVPTGATNFQDYFTEAVDLLPDGGGQIIILEGTYTYSAASVLTKSNVTVKGQGNGTLFTPVASAGAINAFEVTELSGFTFADFKIDGDRTNQSSASPPLAADYQNGIEIVECSDFVVANLTINNMTRRGLSIWSCSDADIIDVKAHNNDYSGVYVNADIAGGDPMNTNIKIINGSYDDNYFAGIYLRYTTQFIVSGNTANGSRDSDGIYIQNTEYGTFSGNAASGNNRNGILAGGRFNTYTGNTCNDNGRFGLILEPYYDNALARWLDEGENVVNGNHAENNGTVDAWASGIFVDGNYNNVQNNKCYNNPTGIEVETPWPVGTGPTMVGNLVTNNDLHGNTTAFTDGGVSTITTAGNRL